MSLAPLVKENDVACENPTNYRRSQLSFKMIDISQLIHSFKIYKLKSMESEINN